MHKPSDIQRSLVNVDDSILVVIDIQDSFLNKCDQTKTQTLVNNVAWLIEVAKELNIPIVAMAEDMKHTGDINKTIRDTLPNSTTVHNKDFFDLTSNSDIMADIRAADRNTAICVGMETDVCVAQSSISLLQLGYNVVVLLDGVASTEVDENIGIGRMRDAGVAISSIKALYYEWLRSVSKCISLGKKNPDLTTIKRPSNLVL